MSDNHVSASLQRGTGNRWRTLLLLSFAVLCGMSLWFAGSAVAPELRQLYSLSDSQTAFLTTIVQLGFVAGTAVSAILNLADIFSSRKYFAGAAVAGAVCNGVLLAQPSFAMVLVSRFLVGVALAGVYPPAMKMISTWFLSGRGLAIGTLVGALTIGKAGPYLVHAVGGASIRAVVLASSAAALLAAILVVVWYDDGPHAFPKRNFSWELAAVVMRQREWRLATLGYLGHMWELYAFWTWITAFFLASMEARQANGLAVPGTATVEMLAFVAIAIGGIGATAGGWIADRIGQERLVIASMALSGACAMGIGLFFGSAPVALSVVAFIWGISVIADSAQFSTMVTRSVPQHAVGTALTLQTSLGFLLTIATIQMIPVVAEVVGWRWSFVLLCVGPLMGIAAITRLMKFARSAEPAV